MLQILKEGEFMPAEEFATPLSLRTLRTTSDDLMGLTVPLGFLTFRWPREAPREKPGVRFDLVAGPTGLRLPRIYTVMYEGSDETRTCSPIRGLWRLPTGVDNSYKPPRGTQSYFPESPEKLRVG